MHREHFDGQDRGNSLSSYVAMAGHISFSRSEACKIDSIFENNKKKNMAKTS
jgi:hypothetical protein